MAGQILMLCQIAQSFALGKHRVALIGGQFAYDDLEQSGFASAVDADDGGFFIIFYMKRNIIQDHVGSE